MIDDQLTSNYSDWISLWEAVKHVARSTTSEISAQILLREQIRKKYIRCRGKLYYKDKFCTDVEFGEDLLRGCTIYWAESRFSYGSTRNILDRSLLDMTRPSDFIEIEVLSADVFRVWPASDRMPDNSATMTDAPEHKNPGGRPRKWDWEGALIEMARVAAFDEESCSRETLTKAVQNWFIKNTGNEPPDSSIRQYVKRFHETLWPPKT